MIRSRIFLSLVPLALFAAACGSQAAATPADRISAYNTLATTVKTDLAGCTAGADDALAAVGLIIQEGSNAGEADLVQLDTISKQAQTLCDETKDNDILNLGGLSVPGSISGMSGLGNVPPDAASWASDDVAAVLHDIQNIAESNGSTVGDASQLQSDESTADSDSTAIYNSFHDAATTLGIATPAIGLVNFEGN